MKSITLVVNDSPVSAMVEPRTHLADFLRQQVGLTGTHVGCEQGVCGACTVLVDGQPQRSCITYAVTCEGREVRTVEGFDSDPTMAALREAFSSYHALQCGFCTPGMLITARDIVARLDGPDEARVRHELAGNLCRCTGYMGIVAAIQGVLEGGQRALLEHPAKAAHALSRPAVHSPRPQAAVQIAPAAAPSQAIDDGDDSNGWATIDDRLTIPHSPDAVWALLSDPQATVRCMPGAQLTAAEGDRVEGQMHIKFGPITATIEGAANQTLAPAARQGQLAGTGSDRASGTKVRFKTLYRVTPADGQAANSASVQLQLCYRLAGPLAQFAREGLIKAFAQRYLATFGDNIDTALKGGTVQSQAPVGGLTALGKIIAGRVRALFNSRGR